MNGLHNCGFADNFKWLRRDLAELKEMVRLGAGIPGDEQRIETLKGVLARWQAFASVTILDAVACRPSIESDAARGERAVQWPLQMGTGNHRRGASTVAEEGLIRRTHRGPSDDGF
jgi:hypothetical protein